MDMADQLIVPSFRLSTAGRWAFPVASTNIWNSLPIDITYASSLVVLTILKDIPLSLLL